MLDQVAVVGAGYIAVELAGVLHHLGSNVSMVIRYSEFLRTFDVTLRQHLMGEMESSGMCCRMVDMLRQGVKFVRNCVVKKVEKNESGQLVLFDSTDTPLPDSYDVVIWAIGRVPLTKDLELSKAGVKCEPKLGTILVCKNKYCVYARLMSTKTRQSKVSMQ